MSQLERMALKDFLFIAVIALFAFQVGQLFAPSPAWAEKPELTEKSIGGNVTATTTAATYTAPSGRQGMFLFKGRSALTDVVYVKMAGTDGQTTASASNYDFRIDAGDSYGVSQHRSKGFSYIAASGSQVIDHFVAYR